MLDGMESTAPTPIPAGRLMLHADGADLAITMPAVPGVRVVIPAKQVEAWGMRKLREAMFSAPAIEAKPAQAAA